MSVFYSIAYIRYKVYIELSREMKKIIFFGEKGEWYLQNVYLVYRDTRKEWRKKMDISKNKLLALGKEAVNEQYRTPV